VLGASGITCLYHAVLYVQQKDKMLFLYANYLFSLTLYLLFRLITSYDSFEYSTNKLAFALDYPIILYMLVSYVVFISRVLNIHQNAGIIKLAVYMFYVVAWTLLVYHLYKVFFTDDCYITRTFFMVSKMALSLWAFVGLIGAWNIRKNTFVRTIIFGGFTYAGFSLLTIISVYTETVIIGLYQYELYFIGCLADILIFSSALGYRYQKVQEEKIATQHALNEELQKNKLLMDRQHVLLQWESEQQKNQLQLQRKVQDEVGAGLSSIHVFADIVRQQLPEGHVASEQVQRVVKESQRLMDDMGDMIWLANLEQQQEWHQRMIARIKDYGLEMLQLSQISCEYIIDPSFYQSKLSKEFIIEKLQAVKLFFQQHQESTKGFSIRFRANQQEPCIEME
jgi:hypothetical protein